MIVDIDSYLDKVFVENDSLQTDLKTMSNFHLMNCSDFNKIVSSRFSPEEIPFITADAFKNSLLSSVPKSQLTGQYSSSGTSGKKTTILLDNMTKKRQMKSLVSILSDCISTERLPMLVLNGNSDLDRNASAAASIGFSLISRSKEHIFQDGEVKFPTLEKLEGKKCLIFAFTYELFDFCKHLNTLGRSFDFSNSIILHGGGWKKVQNSISREDFSALIRSTLGHADVRNYYGMVEQLGLIFVECQNGMMHVPSFSDVIVRSRNDLSVLPDNEVGLLNILNLVPTSYPGTSILTRDIGMVSRKACSCGRQTKIVKIIGREAGSEVRGCSDTK